VKALDRLRKKIEVVTNGYDAKSRADFFALIDKLEDEMKKESSKKEAKVQVNVDEAKVKLVEMEPVTILTVTAFPDSGALDLADLTGVAVSMSARGKKTAARVVGVSIAADKKKADVIHARAHLFVPGDSSDLVGALVKLVPLQRNLDFGGEAK